MWRSQEAAQLLRMTALGLMVICPTCGGPISLECEAGEHACDQCGTLIRLMVEWAPAMDPGRPRFEPPALDA